MSLELSIVLIMTFIIIYVAIIHIFSTLFRMTGLNKEKSRFQSISMFTAVGFTTKESEIIAKDRTRRKIATACMITGNMFSVIIVSLIVNLISNFNVSEEQHAFVFIAIAFSVFICVILVLQLPPVKKGLERLIEFFAAKMFSKNKEDNFITLLDNYGDFAIAEVYINKLPTIFEDKSIFESNLKKDYDINIIMIKRKDRVLTVKRDTMVQVRDEVVVFGNYDKIKQVFRIKNSVEEASTEIKRSENIVELIDNYENQAMIKVYVRDLPPVMKGKNIEESKIKALYGINILMVKRDNRIIEVSRTTSIEVNDEIIVFGPFTNIKYLFIDMQNAQSATTAEANA